MGKALFFGGSRSWTIAERSRGIETVAACLSFATTLTVPPESPPARRVVDRNRSIDEVSDHATSSQDQEDFQRRQCHCGTHMGKPVARLKERPFSTDRRSSTLTRPCMPSTFTLGERCIAAASSRPAKGECPLFDGAKAPHSEPGRPTRPQMGEVGVAAVVGICALGHRGVA